MTEQVSGSSLPQARDLGQQETHQKPEHAQAQAQAREPELEQEVELEQERQRRHTHLDHRSGDSSHHHNRNHNHKHNHNHQHLHHVRSQRNRIPEKRGTSSDENAYSTPDVVVIVETISVLQVTDSAGSTIIRTLPHHQPTTSIIAGSQSEHTDSTPSTASTASTASTTSTSSTSSAASTASTVATDTELSPPTDLPHAASTPTNSSTSNDGNAVADHPSSFSSPTVEDPTVTSSGSSMPTSFPTLSYAPITSTPLSPVPTFPSLSGLSNSTLSSLAFSNSSASLHSFSSASGGNFSAAGATQTRSKSSPASSSSSSSPPPSSSSVFTQTVFGTSTSESSSVAYSTTTVNPVNPGITPATGGDGIGSPADTEGSAGPVPTANSSSDSDNASAATIAGSVVGAVSGLAIILLLAAVIFRWKKRQTSMKLIQASGNDGGDSSATTRGRGDPSGGGGMSERRRSTPFAIPAALANLSGQGRFSKSTVSSDGGERGFAKISGRKLPPVIQFGGDGYTDPRGTMMSDQSIEYRASQNFFGESALSRLAVGSPMLQETSIPVFHSSPARTAVATAGPFSDPFSDDNRIESPTLPPDPVGRSHPRFDRSTRSHGSFSRFTEDL